MYSKWLGTVYTKPSGYALRIGMYGGWDCLHGSFFTQLYLKMHLLSVYECSVCYNICFKVHKYRIVSHAIFLVYILGNKCLSVIEVCNVFLSTILLFF